MTTAAELDLDARKEDDIIYYTWDHDLPCLDLKVGNSVTLKYDGIDILVDIFEFTDDVYSGEVVETNHRADVVDIGDSISFKEVHVFAKQGVTR